MSLQIFINLLIRHLLTTVGGAGLVAGLATDDVTMPIAGALSCAAGVFFSILDKKKR